MGVPFLKVGGVEEEDLGFWLEFWKGALRDSCCLPSKFFSEGEDLGTQIKEDFFCFLTVCQPAQTVFEKGLAVGFFQVGLVKTRVSCHQDSAFSGFEGCCNGDWAVSDVSPEEGTDLLVPDDDVAGDPRKGYPLDPNKDRVLGGRGGDLC
jgi:hypothetical protein